MIAYPKIILNSEAELVAAGISWRGGRVLSPPGILGDLAEESLRGIVTKWLEEDGVEVRIVAEPTLSFTSDHPDAQVSFVQGPFMKFRHRLPHWAMDPRSTARASHHEVLAGLHLYHSFVRIWRDSFAIHFSLALRQLYGFDNLMFEWNEQWPSFGRSSHDEWVPLYEVFRDCGLPLLRFGREYLHPVRTRLSELGVPRERLGKLASLEVL